MNYFANGRCDKCGSKNLKHNGNDFSSIECLDCGWHCAFIPEPECGYIKREEEPRPTDHDLTWEEYKKKHYGKKEK